jgi:hypothetical protein
MMDAPPDRAARAKASIANVIRRTVLCSETMAQHIAELIYREAGRDIMEGWLQDMGEANRW